MRFRLANAWLALTLLVSFGPVGRIHAEPLSEQLVGVVSQIDEVGHAVEVQTSEASTKPHRVWFLMVRETVIRVGRRSGVVADLRVGDEVSVTFFPARLPHTAERVDVL
jgi:hypothetical protein